MPLKTANTYAKLAVDLGNIAADLKPAERDPYAESLKLIQFYLQSAAARARQIAEHISAAQGAPQ